MVLNPVRARIVAAPGDWPWSSYRAMTGETPAPGWLESDAVLRAFAEERHAAGYLRGYLRVRSLFWPILTPLKPTQGGRTMPRKRRFFLPGVPVHVVQRGNNRQAVFFDENDYRVYLDWLSAAASEHGSAIHAYVLMTNHIHLRMTPTDQEAISATLQALGRRFVPYINHCYGRTGNLWEGRFKASAVQEEGYLMACYRYVELNPVRAGMVELPRQRTGHP